MTVEDIVAQAILAPSAHNTQPARWRALPGGELRLFGDLSRRLGISDPDERDFHISCGMALEGTVLALASMGQGALVTRLSLPDEHGLRPIADILPQGPADPEDAALAQHMQARTTLRTGFAPYDGPFDALTAPHVTCVTERSDINWLAGQIDQASARLMRSKHLRRELLEWMRLRPDHPNYHVDGMNRDALALDGFAAKMAEPILGSGIYDLLSTLGLGPSLAGEAARSREASAMLLIHWPKGGDMVDAGRAFYRTWLAVARLGLVGWPAAALADDASTQSQITTRFGLQKEQSLINVLRIGAAKGPMPHRARRTIPDFLA